MKTVGISAINKRIKDIANTFGTESSVYKKAIKYLKNEIKDEYLAMDASGNITGIRQTKAAKADVNRVRFHPDELDEQIPTIEKLILEQRTRFLENNSIADKVLTSYTVKEVRNSFSIFAAYASPIEAIYSDLNKFDTLLLEVYDVRDNKRKLSTQIYNDKAYHSRAIDALNDKKRTGDWVAKARKLVTEYEDDVNTQIASRITNRYKK